jgi:ribose transport system permease protein
MQPPAAQAPVAEQNDTAGPASAGRRSALGAFGARYGVVSAMLILLLIGTSLFVPYFLTVNNLLNILQQMAIVGVIGIGMTFVILTAGIDLSVGSILELVTVVFALLLKDGVTPWMAVLAGIAIGGAVGVVNGLGYTVFGIQPFVMTLASLAVAEGLALTLSNGSEVNFSASSPLLNFLGNGGIGQLSGEFVIFAALAIVGWLVLRYRPFGRFVYAVGGSRETSRLSGIRVKRVLASVYVISGCCAGLAGIMTAARLQVGTPTAGALMNLDAIAAVVIGGTSLMGGRGSMWGSVLGAFVLAVIANVITLLGVSPYQSEIVRGGVIVAAVLIGSAGLIRKKRAKAHPPDSAHAGSAHPAPIATRMHEGDVG